MTNEPVSRVVWPGSSVLFSVGVSGKNPLSYQWLFNGVALTNTTITTVCGGAASNLVMSAPCGVTLDLDGNLLIADHSSNCVRKMSFNGVVTTIAGTGANNYSGDGGPAQNATLRLPSYAVMDNASNVYIADTRNYRIRRIDRTGIITTVAGNGTAGFSGDGGPATAASLNAPACIAFDSHGALVFTDYGNNRVRRVETNGIINTIIGNGSATHAGDGGPATQAGIDSPWSVTIDSKDNIYVTDSGNAGNYVRKVDPQGIISTVAGGGSATGLGDGGSATNATLSLPSGLSVDASGNLYIADSGNNRIRKVDTNGIITTIAGNGTNGYAGDGGVALSAKLSYPSSIAFDVAGNCFITDQHNNCVRRMANTIGPMLLLNYVTITNSGSYQVVVTNSDGSTTSSIANLNVASGPYTYGTHLNADQSLTLDCVSPPGSTNVVLLATNLANPTVWTPVFTNVAQTDGTWQYTGTNLATRTRAFYKFSVYK